MLQETGNQRNQLSAVQLLSKFTEIFEHLIVEDPDSQTTIYLRSMKSTLKTLQETAENASIPEPSADCSHKPKFEPVPETQTESLNGDVDDSPHTAIELPETQPFDAETATVAKTGKEEIKGAEDDEKKSLIKSENENSCKLKSEINSVKDFGMKLSDDANDLLNLPNETEVEVEEVKMKLMALMKNSRKEYRKLMRGLRGAPRIEYDLNEMSKKNLITKTESSDSMTSDSEDLDQALNPNRKIPKTSKAPAVVSSTKEDSNASKEDEPIVRTHSSSSSSDESGTCGQEKNTGKDIERLVDLSSLNYSNPASSKKVIKSKKLTKKKKKQSSDLESISTSEEDNSTNTPPSSPSILSVSLSFDMS
jgi:hypothetical protein